MSEKVYIAQLAEAIDRREGTIRDWCRNGKLPKRLKPRRDSETGWRYWTPAQVAGVKKWMVESRMIPGGGLRYYDPTPEQADELLAKLRRERAA